MNKRGLSPLVATVLLIVFAVALGALVLNYGESFIHDVEVRAPGVPAACPMGCIDLEQIVSEGETVVYDEA